MSLTGIGKKDGPDETSPASETIGTIDPSMAIASISAQLGGMQPPASMDSSTFVPFRSDGVNIQMRSSAGAATTAANNFEIVESGARGVNAELTRWNAASEKIIGDKDGDGIPDQFDKYPGRSVADIAAAVHGIGKYAKSADSFRKIFSALKKTMDNTLAMLEKLAGLAAAVNNPDIKRKITDEIDNLKGNSDTIKKAAGLED
jgi:hypothetical protein